MITRELLRQWNACYTDARIAELVPPQGLTPLEVCDLEIQAEDRLWVLLREEVTPAGQLRLLACKWARGVLEAERAAGREPDARSWAAVETAERFARGEATEDAMAAAWDAASDAVSDAAWAARAAWDAASNAVSDAARAARAAANAAASAAARAARAAANAAWAAASAAAWGAASSTARATASVAWAAARDAAWDAQLADVRAWIAAHKCARRNGVEVWHGRVDGRRLCSSTTEAGALVAALEAAEHKGTP